jgi:ATP-dependent exoDNAse (exonuclease V) beta subunit
LEFENVFIADLYRAKNKVRLEKIIFHKELDFPLALSKAASDTPDADNISLAYAQARRIQQQLELAERRRLFYVAVTRAKTNLFLSAAYKPDKEPDENCLQTRNWGQWLRYFYTTQPQFFQEAAVLELTEPPLVTAGGTGRQTIKSLPEYQSKSAAPDEPHYKLNSLPATLASSLLADKKKFVLDYFHGFTATEFSAKNKTTAENLDMAKIGTAVHKAIAAGEGNIPDNFSAAEKACARQCLDNYAQSGLSERLKQASEYYYELNMEYLSGGVRYNGIADLAVRTTAGWEIYDFKTSRKHTPENEAKYKNQLAIYAAILKQQFPDLPVKCFIFYLYAEKTPTPVEIEENIFAKCMEKIKNPANL